MASAVEKLIAYCDLPIQTMMKRISDEWQHEKDKFLASISNGTVMQEWGMDVEPLSPYQLPSLPDHCHRVNGEILSLPIKARLVRRSEKRREQMYRILWALEERAPWAKKREELVKYKEPLYKEGGPVAWKYLPERCKNMLIRRQITLVEAKACAQFVYLHQNDWLLWAPGTNFPRGEKLSGGGNKTHNHYAGKAFPIHLLEKPVLDILVAGLIAEVPFKSLPGVKPGKSITMHRQGKRFFLGAIKRFERILTR